MLGAPDGSKPTLYVVDALNFLFRAFHALPPLTTRQGLQTGALYGLANMLLRIERENRPSHICVVFDAPGRTFRDDLYPAYKAQRPPMPPELAAQIPVVPEVVRAFGLATLSVPGFEADDVIATLARRAVAAGMDVVICSGDKDLLQLCGDGIRILDTMKNRFLGVDEVKEKFGVPPERVGDVLALMGDSVDNVPGVPGIGPKTAAELINRFGNLDELLRRASEVKGKRGEALVAARDRVPLSRRLVALCEDVPLPGTLEDLHRIDPDRVALEDLFRRLEFSRLLAQVGAAGDAAARDAQAGGQPGAQAGSAASGEQGGQAGGAAGSAAGAAGGAAGPSASGDLRPTAAGLVAGSPPAAEPPGLDGATTRAATLSAAGTTPEPSPALPVSIVSDAAALRALVDAVGAAGSVGVAALTDGPDAVRAGLVGLAFALPAGQRAYLPLGHRYIGAPPSLREAEALGVLGPVLADARVAKHVHDGKAVEVLLAVRGVALRGQASDAMIAAYLLDASRTRYDLDVVAAAEGVPGVAPRSAWLGTGRTARAPADVAVEQAAAPLAAEAGAALALAPLLDAKIDAASLGALYRDLELPLTHVLARIEERGVRLDVDYLRALGHEVATAAAALEAEIHSLAGAPFNIGSPKQLADVLFGKLGLPPLRKTKTGWSTDADVLEELAAAHPEHPAPRKIIEYRMLTKLKGTYIDALPALVNPRTGRLHTTFNQTVAATGRISSSDPNLQNIPIRSELGRRIRRAFVAPPGQRIVSADYSQIELRVLAHFAKDAVLVDAFRSGQDVHQRTACEIFGVAPDAVTAAQRSVAKAINFGLVFGQTDYGLAQALGIERAAAKRYIESYFQRYAGVRAYMERSIEDARRTGEVTTILGRRRPLPEIRAARQQDRAYAERIARNTPIQGSAADILKRAMLRVEGELEAGRAPPARLLLTVHDELVFEVPEGAVAELSAWVKHEMEQVVTLIVPLVVDVGSGANWGEAH